METLINVLQNDAVITLIATVLGLAWAVFKASDKWKEIADARYADAILALEAGVELTYQTYVKAIKAARADGKLTEEERTEARRLAREAAISFARTRGLDLIKTIGFEYLDLWISKIVKQAKAENKAA